MPRWIATSRQCGDRYGCNALMLGTAGCRSQSMPPDWMTLMGGTVGCFAAGILAWSPGDGQLSGAPDFGSTKPLTIIAIVATIGYKGVDDGNRYSGPRSHRWAR